MEEEEIYKAAADSWGIPLQRIMVAEECCELALSVLRFFRGRTTELDIVEEMVDAQLMINQMRSVLGMEDEWADFYAYKLSRIEERLREEESKVPSRHVDPKLKNHLTETERSVPEGRG